MKRFEINNKQNVIDFFAYLLNDLSVNFHPDDDLADYINSKTNTPTFTPEEVLHLEATYLMGGPIPDSLWGLAILRTGDATGRTRMP